MIIFLESSQSDECFICTKNYASWLLKYFCVRSVVMGVHQLCWGWEEKGRDCISLSLALSLPLLMCAKFCWDVITQMSLLFALSDALGCKILGSYWWWLCKLQQTHFICGYTHCDVGHSLIFRHTCLCNKLHLPACPTHYLPTCWQTEHTNTILFSVFGTNCYPHILILSGKGDVHADKEPVNERKRKLVILLEVVEVFNYLDMGMSIAEVRCHHGINKLRIFFKEKWK